MLGYIFKISLLFYRDVKCMLILILSRLYTPLNVVYLPCPFYIVIKRTKNITEVESLLNVIQAFGNVIIRISSFEHFISVDTQPTHVAV